MTNIEKAKELAAKQWRVFPVHYIREDGKCSCLKPKCEKSPGKHPMTEHGFNDATTDVKQIEYWWGKHPEANIGVATGLSNLVVIDIDIKETNEGEQFFDILAGEDKNTRTIKTGSGGFHYYYNADPDVKIISSTNFNEIKGLDIRAIGGYVLVEGSNHLSGRNYEILLDAPIIDLPEKIKQFLNPDKDVKAITRHEVKSEVIEGNRNNELTKMAGKLLGQRFPPDVTLEMLFAYNDKYVSPPLAHEEIQRIVVNIYKKEQAKPEPTKQEEIPEPEAVVNITQNLYNFPMFMNRFLGKESDWIIQDWLPEGAFCFLAAPPETYKSWMSLDAAISIGGAKDRFLGLFEIKKNGCVLIINQEDNPTNMAQRCMDILDTGSDDENDLFCDYKIPNILFYSGKDINIRNPRCIKFIEKIIERYGVILTIIDPLYSILGTVDMNFNDATPYLAELKLLRDKYNCAFVFVHHTTKSVVGAVRARDRMFGGILLNASLEQSIILSRVVNANTVNPVINVVSSTKYGEKPNEVDLELTWENGFKAKIYNENSIVGVVTHSYEVLTELSLLEIIGNGPQKGSDFPYIKSFYGEHVSTNEIVGMLTKLVIANKLKVDGDFYSMSKQNISLEHLKEQYELKTNQIEEMRKLGDSATLMMLINQKATIERQLALFKNAK